MNEWFWLVISSLLSCAGQLCQKQATTKHDRSIIALWLGLALIALGCSLFAWLTVLRDIPVSIAYPLLSINFIWITLADRMIWHTPVTRSQWSGMLLIVAGIVLLGGSR